MDHVSGINEIKINTTTLQSVIDENDFYPSYIKVDVEGHELQILQGLDFKSPILSFEWISELSEKNCECLREAGRIGYTRFNLSTREEEVLGPEDEWLNLDDAILKFDMIKNHDVKNNIWGNVWCL